MFFSPSRSCLVIRPSEGPPSLFQCSQGLKNTKEPLSRFFEAAPETHKTIRRLAHSTVAVRFSVSRVFFCSFDTAHAARLLPSARTKCTPTCPCRRHTKKRDTHHGGECRVEAEGDACRHATASPHRQFSTERACCSNRARSRSCAHRASACCRERVRGTCGDRTHRASQRRPCG